MAKDIGLADFFQSAQDFPKRVELITELEQDPLLLFEMQFDDKSIQFYFSNN